MCFGPSTLGAGAKICLGSRIKEFTPHFICRLASPIMCARKQARELPKCCYSPHVIPMNKTRFFFWAASSRPARPAVTLSSGASRDVNRAGSLPAMMYWKHSGSERFRCKRCRKKSPKVGGAMPGDEVMRKSTTCQTVVILPPRCTAHESSMVLPPWYTANESSMVLPQCAAKHRSTLCRRQVKTRAETVPGAC